jgi:hypothetical protein
VQARSARHSSGEAPRIDLIDDFHQTARPHAQIMAGSLTRAIAFPPQPEGPGEDSFPIRNNVAVDLDVLVDHGGDREAVGRSFGDPASVQIPGCSDRGRRRIEVVDEKAGERR